MTENILSRLGPIDILENAQKVCTTWRSVCCEPSMWRVVDMKYSDIADYERLGFLNFLSVGVICRRAVDLSQGELIDISIDGFGTDDLMHYISERISQNWKSLHLFFMSRINAEHVEGISASCPKLKSFTFNRRNYRFELLKIDDSCALTISRNMPNLQHLCLMGNQMNNEGLKAILNGCPNLESLDISKCYGVDLQGDFGKICSERIKSLKRLFDSYDRVDNDWDDLIYDHEDYGYDSSDYENYDEYDPFLYFI
ncbi:hypothetical protein CASFOL_014542 [Castilleja foliolosa]|uniref:F-box domain-containing protein n=1 Tax=Castilleja foliolosa TaxID=1961234 RepID=A0ABD3DQT8_9LAMI